MNKYSNQILLFLFTSILCFSSYSQQQISFNPIDKCSRILTHSGDIQISRSWDEESRLCTLAFHPMDVENLTYRDFSIDNYGQFFVFNSYGDGPITSSTSSRVFYILPTTYDYPDFEILPNGDVRVQLASGHIMILNSIKFGIKSITQGNIVEKKLSPNNRGGIEISLSKGLLVDSGYKTGGMALENKKNQSQIKGINNSTCLIRNGDFFDYTLDFIHPKYNQTNSSVFLSDYLKKVCPQVNFTL